MSQIDWIALSCRLLARISAEFSQSKPFAGLTIGAAIHLEPKTVVLLRTLAEGGADIVATGNIGTTQAESVRFLRAAGTTVIGEHADEPELHDSRLQEVLSHRPDILLDNGGGLFSRYLDDPYPSLRGGTEETTSGRDRLRPLRDRLDRPVLVVNDSPIKQFAENKHAVGLSVLESLLRITNRAPNGRRATVVGYGPCGRGVALALRNTHARVAVLETDPVLRLEALLDGYAVPDRQEALARAEILVTVTGAPRIVTGADLPLLADGVILANAGHVPWEIDVADLLSSPDVRSHSETAEGVTSIDLTDGRRVHVLVGGHMVNLSGPRPLGNSAESMDLGFSLQARCLEAIASGTVGSERCVVPVPEEIDRRVAEAYVALANGDRRSGAPTL
jgi:adenosylhomocysteinase